MSNLLPENPEKVRWNDSKILADQKVVLAKWNMHRTFIWRIGLHVLRVSV